MIPMLCSVISAGGFVHSSIVLTYPPGKSRLVLFSRESTIERDGLKPNDIILSVVVSPTVITNAFLGILLETLERVTSKSGIKTPRGFFNPERRFSGRRIT